MTPRRISCIWMPHFAIQRWRHRCQRPWQDSDASDVETGDEAPLVLVREGPHGPVIYDVSRAAAALGMSVGARVTDMRTLVPALHVEDADPEADAADLERLAGWARRWCPWTQVAGDNMLLLDTSGSDHLHGGEAAMQADMVAAFGRTGLTVRVSTAPTIGAAWALARHASTARVICPAETLAEMLAPLPTTALRLDSDTVLLLRRLGLKTIGALAGLPREALVRRFRRIETAQRNPVLRLDQAMGRVPEPLVAATDSPPLRVLRRLAEPLGDASGLTLILADLCADLCTLMDERHAGARALRFTAYRVDGSMVHVSARTSRASRTPAHLTRLFDGKLDHVDPGFGVDAAALEVLRADALGAVQDDLSGEVREDIAFSRLIDRLAARLGEDRILRPVARGSHLPERGEAFMPAAAEGKAEPHAVSRSGSSPLRLLMQPEEAQVTHAVPEGPPARFVWRRQTHDVTRTAGPERIAPEWWRQPGHTRLRDYYRVEDTEGRRFWLYREGLAGDGRGGNPRWFVHGLDA
ncbi:MAG: DUF6504 family protein [Pacificimonas sp.]